MNKYQELKEKARNEAMDFQASFIDNCYSYGELAEYTEYFTKLGKRYGLLKEFRENAII